MIDLSTIAGLHAHDHQLAAYCPRCDAWRMLPLSDRVCQGKGIAASSAAGALPGLRRGRAAAGTSANAGALIDRLDSAALMQKPRRGAGDVTETPLADQFGVVVPGAVGAAVGSGAGAVAGTAVAGCSCRGIGITKLAGYCRRISVIESMIP